MLQEEYRLSNALLPKLTGLLLSGVMVIGTSSAQEGADSYQVPALKEWATNIYYPSIPHLGGAKVEIWETPSSGFVFKPYMAVDWQSLEAQLAERCDGRDPATEAEISAAIEFDSTPSRSQAVTVTKRAFEGLPKSAHKSLEKLNEATLRAFPFASLRVTTGGRAGDDLPPYERRRLPDAEGISAAAYVTGLNTGVIGVKDVPIRDTCEMLRRIVEGKNIQGQAFITYDTQSITSLFVSLSQVGNSEAFTDLIYAEEQTGEKKMLWSSKSGGWGINVPGAYIGQQKSSGTAGTVDTRHRAVSNNVLTRAIAEAASSLTVTTVTPAGDKNPMAPEKVLSLVREFVMKRADALTANFSETDAGWELVTAYGKQPLAKVDVDEIIAIKTEQEDMAKTDQSVKYEGAEAGDKRDQLQKMLNDIRWEKKGGDYIPVSVDLRELRASDLDVNADMAWEDIVSTAGADLMLVDLAMIDLDRQEYRTGYAEGQKALEAPPKIVIPLSIHHHIVWPQAPGAPTPPGLGEYYSCQDPTSARGKAVQILEAGTKPEIDEFVKQIGCELATPEIGASCQNNTACRIYIRTPDCLTPNDWYIWYGAMAIRNGLDSHSAPWSYCLEERRTQSEMVPGPHTMPYPIFN